MLAMRKPRLSYDPVQLVGTITKIDADLVTVDCDGTLWSCPQALSCLIEPQIGDEVIISGPDRTRVYLIAVIARPDAAAITLNVNRDLTIRSSTGSISMQSAAGTHIGSDTSVELRAPRLEQTHDNASLTVRQMQYAGETLEATVGRSTFFSNVISLMADRINTVARLCFRHIRDVDHVRARSIDYEAETLTRVHGGYTTLTARDVMKINGDQIHMS